MGSPLLPGCRRHSLGWHCRTLMTEPSPVFPARSPRLFLPLFPRAHRPAPRLCRAPRSSPNVARFVPLSLPPVPFPLCPPSGSLCILRGPARACPPSRCFSDAPGWSGLPWAPGLPCRAVSTTVDCHACLCMCHPHQLIHLIASRVAWLGAREMFVCGAQNRGSLPSAPKPP